MGEGSWTAVYLLLGLGLVAGLYYALTQIMARQSRLNAELTRLERLAAEVAMNAEAILDRVDERIDTLNRLAEEIEAKARAAGAVAAATEVQTGAGAVTPATPAPQPATGHPHPRGRKRSSQRPPAQPGQVISAEPETPQPEPVPAPEPAQDEPAPAQYRDRRLAVSALADEGKDAGEIALALGIPRGEVQLILNLRGRKVNG